MNQNHTYKVVKNIEQYNEDYVYFLEPIKNNIMNNGKFIRIIYSTPFFSLNGIYINININHYNIDKYYNKYKCTFDIVQHHELIEKIRNIENALLKKMSIVNKESKCNIYEQLNSGFIKLFSESIDKISNNFLLKISGVWETDNEYGLTYKFLIL